MGGATLGYGSQRSKTATNWHRSPLPAAAPLGTGAAEEPHGPSRDSPGTDSPSTLTTARGHIPLPAQRPSMEVTTVSPSPASATEGDDLCEIDVTNVAIHSVTLLISLCGLLGNGAVLGLLSLDLCNSYIFDLAFADFLFLLFTVPSTLLFLVEDMSCSSVVPLLYLQFLFQLSAVSSYTLLFWMMWNSYSAFFFYFFLIQDLLYYSCPCKVPERLLWFVGSFQFWVFFALFSVISAMTNLCPSHEQEHCQAALISMYTSIVLLCAAPVVISSTMNFINAMRGCKRLKSNRHCIVMFFIVLLILLLNISNFLRQLGYTVMSSEVFFMLNCIHSSINPFILFLAGRCWRPCSLGSLRLSLQRLLEEPEENSAHSNDPATDTVL
ncbi:mas-related G-protein coupled receptor member A8-like [Sylvia atricapilla]|uniref:mas-related G-protein coupled receptor member A8-like n=1 Tax=Sylvia atricapilla TaxID=48155 RepID=UPI0033994A1E